MSIYNFKIFQYNLSRFSDIRAKSFKTRSEQDFGKGDMIRWERCLRAGGLWTDRFNSWDNWQDTCG